MRVAMEILGYIKDAGVDELGVGEVSDDWIHLCCRTDEQFREALLKVVPLIGKELMDNKQVRSVLIDYLIYEIKIKVEARD
jgi:hypothetical protein